MSGNEQLQQQRNQHDFLNAQAEAQQQQAPQLQQDQPQQAGRLHQLGRRMADWILRRVPAAAGDAQSPQAPQPAPPVQQQAPRSKQERRLLQQEEEQRRLEEEQRQRAEAEEAQRLDQYRQLVNQDAVRNAMGEFANAEEAQTMDKAKEFLLTAARALHGQDGPAPETEHTKMVDSYRVLVARHVQNDEQAQALSDALDTFEHSFRETAELERLIPIINRDVAFVFRNEIEHIPMLKQAMERLTADTAQKSSRRSGEFSAFEDTVARALDVQAGPEQDTASVTQSPFYAAELQEDVRAQFRQTVADVMEAQNLTREAARARVLADMRNSAKRDMAHRAAAISLENGVVHNVSREDMERHGSASFQQTLPAEQAKKVLSASNGFLYGKQVDGDLVELRPTLPETAEINGKTYPLRRDYNLLIKSIVSQIIGEDGKLLEGADDFAATFSTAFFGDLASSTGSRIKSVIQNTVQGTIKPGLKKFLGEGEALDSTLGRLEALVFETLNYDAERNCKGTTLLPREILEAVEGFVITASQTAVPLEQRKQTVRAAMEKDGASEEEIAAQLEALTSMYQDRDAALQEMLKIRGMDPDSPDIPLPNACSANGLFFEGMTKVLLPEQLHRLEYFTDSHITADPQSHLDYIRRKNPGIETEEHPLYMSYKNTAEELNQNPPALSAASIDFLTKQTSKDMKYAYHVAAQVGSLEDGTAITVEEFAAETTQLMVSPFSTRGAVGLYRGGRAGMDGYYNLDNPLPTEEGQILSRTNHEIRGNSLPGDKYYTPKRRQAAGAGGNAQ